MKKTCTKCKVEKESCDFSKDKNTKSGTRSHCKKCHKERYEANKEEILKKQKERYSFDKIREYYYKNIDRHKERNKKWYEKNREAVLIEKKNNYNKELRKEYYLKNKDMLNKRSAERQTKKRHKDPILRLKHNTSCLIRLSIRKMGFVKSAKTEQILGCTTKEFMEHLSNLFLDGMSFENHGEWHIDHIIPLSKGKTEEEVIKLNHYTNLQPLWAKDNLRKSNKHTETYGK